MSNPSHPAFIYRFDVATTPVGAHRFSRCVVYFSLVR